MQQRWAIPQNNVEESAGHQHGWLGESFFTTVALKMTYSLTVQTVTQHIFAPPGDRDNAGYRKARCLKR